MYQNDAIIQNTIHVNDVLVRIFKLVPVFMLALIVMKAAGFIVLGWLSLAIIAAAVTLACMIPIACRRFRMDAELIKRVSIYCTSILCLFCYCYLNMQSIILLAIPVGFACMYFDMKLIKITAGISAAGFILGEALCRIPGWGVQDFLNEIGSGIILEAIQLLIVLAILITISKNSQSMQDSMKSLYEDISSLVSDIQGSSQGLGEAEGIIQKNISLLVSGTAKDKEAAAIADEELTVSGIKARSIISNINKSMDNAKDMIRYTHTMLKRKGRDLKAEDEAKKIDEYDKNIMQTVSKLSCQTEKIKEAMKLIEIIINESKQLSMNAAAEAEAAEEDGEGPVILAIKVEKLAEETAISAEHIQEVLGSVVDDAESTLRSISKVYRELLKSLELINRSVETLVKWSMYKNVN
ncbi:MAG TPA: methyl-accepting chemotaxis protein [Negativicutes bacterium]|nr:methyl-accepting chemotaxis protein [Negativicutes bacterium]